MLKKATGSKKTVKVSTPRKDSDIDKSPSISSPPSKFLNITKILKSPACDGKPMKSRKTKTKKSSDKNGKTKCEIVNSCVEESLDVGENAITGFNETSLCQTKHRTNVTGNISDATIATQMQEQDFRQKGKNLISSIPGEDLQTCPPVGDALNTPHSKAKGEGSGRTAMIQTNLSITKDGIEVLSSPEQKETKKKRKKPSDSKKKDKMQTRITNIFPLRKSNRKTKSQQEKDEQARITKAIISKTFEGLQVRTIEEKGRGVFATRNFRRNEFVCEYSGELISPNEAEKREKRYSEDSSIGCYMYYLQFNNKKYCIDATTEDGTLGRLLNHSRSGNCKSKVHVIKDQPHLILVTTRDVSTGEELTYDYGDRSKDSLQSHPWLKY